MNVRMVVVWGIFFSTRFLTAQSVDYRVVDTTAVCQLVENAYQFEFWNRGDQPIYVKIGTRTEWADAFVSVQSNQRLMSSDHIVKAIFSTKEQPTFVSEVTFLVFNPFKTVFIQTRDNKTIEPQRGALARPKTKSGLSLKSNITDVRDMVWYPWPDKQVQYEPNASNILFNAVRVLDGDITSMPKDIEDISLRVQQRSQNNWTPLHEAALWEDAKMYRYFVDAGADEGAQDVFGRTARDVWRGGRNWAGNILQEIIFSPIVQQIDNLMYRYVLSVIAVIEALKKGEKVTIPVWDETTYKKLLSRARKELNSNKYARVSDAIAKSLDARGNVYLNLFGTLNLESADLQIAPYQDFYDQIKVALEAHGQRLIQPNELYEFIGLDSNRRELYTQETIKNKINEKKMALNNPEQGTVEFLTLREVSHVLTGGFKSMYDAFLSGQKAYEAFREQVQTVQDQDRLIKAIEVIGTFQYKLSAIFLP